MKLLMNLQDVLDYLNERATTATAETDRCQEFLRSIGLACEMWFDEIGLGWKPYGAEQTRKFHIVDFTGQPIRYRKREDRIFAAEKLDRFLELVRGRLSAMVTEIDAERERMSDHDEQHTATAS